MFIPHTEAERKQMLKIIGKEKIDDLFTDVPEQFRFPRLNLPPALNEMQALDFINKFANSNYESDNAICFLGAGAYNHYIPAAVDYILRHGEFFTAYTPYQSEISQGTLQAIFEFQTLIAKLTGMDLSNASHYDGATAAAEACLTAYHYFRGKKTKFVLSPSLNPQYRATITTYLSGIKENLIVGDDPTNDPLQSPSILTKFIDENTSLVIVQYPDFFGRIFDFTQLADIVHEKGALFAVAVNPIALGLLKPPGDFGADIVVGEGQPLGIPLSFGGPYLGFFAANKKFVRKMSGRLVGETKDTKGRRGYVLTLTAREQHIRRGKATSNICTNQSLMALAATVYLSVLGKSGFHRVSELCYHRAHYAAERINKVDGYKVLTSSPFFHEFIVKCPKSVNLINKQLLQEGIIGGYELEKDYPSLKNCMLLAVTERIEKSHIDLLCKTLEEKRND
mgnify:CR=1 FL=1